MRESGWELDKGGTSLAAQWLRLLVSIAGVQVQSLVEELLIRFCLPMAKKQTNKKSLELNKDKKTTYQL